MAKKDKKVVISFTTSETVAEALDALVESLDTDGVVKITRSDVITYSIIQLIKSAYEHSQENNKKEEE